MYRCDLSENCLLEISPNFKNLTKLASLDLSSNLIGKIPIDLYSLDSLKMLFCHQNPIQWPPQEIWKDRDEDMNGNVWPRVNNFFHQLTISGQIENVSMKVMVLGRSECGKTSLINALLLDHSKLVRKGDRTLGIEQRQWIVHSNDNSHRPYELTVLDFAGQDEYYVTHHLYLSSRALYLVAFDLSICRTEADVDSMVGFYMNLLQMRLCGSSPGIKVLLVGTHADQIDADTAKYRCDMVLRRLRSLLMLNIQHWKKEIKGAEERIEELVDLRNMSKDLTDGEDNSQEYISRLREQKEGIETRLKFLIALPEKVHSVSSASGLKGLPELRCDVKVSILDRTFFPQMCETIPLFYENFRNYIRENRRVTPYYNWEEHVRCVREQLGSELDAETIRSATDFMHHLGELLFTNESATVFLDVQWLVDAMKLVIRHDHDETLFWKDDMDLQTDLFMRNRIYFEENIKKKFLKRGELPVELLAYLWNDLNLDANIFSDLVTLLEDFEIIVAFGPIGADDIPKTFLVPTFAPHNLKLSSQSVSEKMNPSVHLFTCTAAFPAAMMQRLQVLLSKKSTSVVLTKDSAEASWNGYCDFLLKLKSPCQLELTVWAKNGEDALVTAREIADSINIFFCQWPGMLTIEEMQYEQPSTGETYLIRPHDLEILLDVDTKHVSCLKKGNFAAGGFDHPREGKKWFDVDNVPIRELVGTLKEN